MQWRTFWKRSVAPQIVTLSVRTREEYERLWGKELEPIIGREDMGEMDYRRANEVVAQIGSPSVQRHAGALLRKMCNMAVREGLMRSNPVTHLQYKPHRRKRKELIESLDVAPFLEAIRGIKYEPLLLCELGAGLRVEEACALAWEDISPLEFMGKIYAAIDVNKALVPTKGGLVLKDVKTEKSARIAIMGEPFASRLLTLRKGKQGLISHSDALRRDYTSPITVTHNYREWCGAHGVRYVPQKDLRSSYATIMGEAGAQDSVVSGNMGHTDGTVKGTNYQTVTIAAKCRAADALGEWLCQLAPNCFPSVAHNWHIERKCAVQREKRGVNPPQVKHGASDRNRTRNPLITKLENSWADMGL